MNHYPHINETYISGKLKEHLLEIAKYPITVISAPTGYGKTTAVKWWDEYRKRYISDSVLYRLTAVEESLTNFWENLCMLLKKDQPELAEQMLKIGFPETGRTMILLDELWGRIEENIKKEVFFVFDDVQLLPSEQLSPFLIFLAEHLPRNIHIILLSRDFVFTASQSMKLGRTLLKIPREVLQLDKTEVAAYAELCGLPLSEEDAEKLASFSDGWISFIYLVFCIFTKSGKWQFDTADVNRLIEEVMLEPLPARAQKFLTVMSVTPEFTQDEAAFLWNEADAALLLEKLSSENAFITRDTDDVYRCHNLLLQNTIKLFATLPQEEQKAAWKRLGDWHVLKREALSAMTSYRKAEAWEDLMNTVTFDRGSSFSGVHKKIICDWCENCPEKILRSRPEAILIFSLQYFTAGDIPNMLRLNDMLRDVVKNDTDLSDQERDDFAGESEILLSFLEFNDISAMSAHHRKACSLMSRESFLVNHRNSWTFGSPSVLLLYHRTSGEIDGENEEMRECMPYYYQLTDGHGNGAEHSMQAETYLMQGAFQDAEISYYQASRAAVRKGQYSILITAEFTAVRFLLLRGDYQGAKGHIENLRKSIIENSQFILLPVIDMCIAWIAALLGCTEKIPEWILQENAIHTTMSVAAPTFLTIQGAVLLSMGEWTRLVSKGDEIKTICEKGNMLLCGIYARIHLSAAYEKLNRETQALAELKEALTLAVPDKLILPFAENSSYIRKLLEKCRRQGHFPEAVEEICRLADVFEDAKGNILRKYFGKSSDYGLSERELEIAHLAAERRTTKEISETLCLSENTVKVHLKHIFEKLNISGTSRNKREILGKKLN